MQQQQQISRKFQKPQKCMNSKSTNKRARDAREESADTAHVKANGKVEPTMENEDSTFNSFQFWRVPLPELDMSLLLEPPKKDSSSEEMET
ncbi:hypothetical protein WMY93_004777 [Mugilogobius chulae]|uniref:Putative WW-binding domain-containing protein n=1 Tax=Mugilogobius chulae TaxID=88201 RepID=A0AAW0Q083_9GOBI